MCCVATPEHWRLVTARLFNRDVAVIDGFLRWFGVGGQPQSGVVVPGANKSVIAYKFGARISVESFALLICLFRVAQVFINCFCAGAEKTSIAIRQHAQTDAIVVARR